MNFYPHLTTVQLSRPDQGGKEFSTWHLSKLYSLGFKHLSEQDYKHKGRGRTNSKVPPADVSGGWTFMEGDHAEAKMKDLGDSLRVLLQRKKFRCQIVNSQAIFKVSHD